PVVGAMTLLFAAGCTPPPPADAPALSSDPASAEAASLRSRCGPLRGEREAGCYDAALLVLLREQGVGASMRVLERLGEMDERIRGQGHLFAHSIGLAALSGPEQVGAT